MNRATISSRYDVVAACRGQMDDNDEGPAKIFEGKLLARNGGSEQRR